MSARAAEAYLPLRQCVEILGAALAPAAARSLLLECLNGIKCKARARAACGALHDLVLLPHMLFSGALSHASLWHTFMRDGLPHIYLQRTV